jgi:hypothetical protein
LKRARVSQQKSARCLEAGWATAGTPITVASPESCKP